MHIILPCDRFVSKVRNETKRKLDGIYIYIFESILRVIIYIRKNSTHVKLMKQY